MSSNTFPVPFTLYQLRSDIAEVFLVQARIFYDTFGIEAAMPLLGSSKLVLPDWDTSTGAKECGLRYEHICHLRAAQMMEVMYEFGFHGRFDLGVGIQQFSEDGYFGFVAAWLHDLHQSHALRMFEQFDNDSLLRCLKTVDLANARSVMEHGESFYTGRPGEPDSSDEFEANLTIRQVALLAGMEEMSIRAAANPKRASALPTISTDGGTRVARDVAKTWLQSKGRYVPLVNYLSKQDIDLTTTHFPNPDDLREALGMRRIALTEQRGRRVIDSRLMKLGLKVSEGDQAIAVSTDQFRDETFVRRLAKALELPEELFALRCMQMLAIYNLAIVDQKLRTQLTSTK